MPFNHPKRARSLPLAPPVQRIAACRSSTYYQQVSTLEWLLTQEHSASENPIGRSGWSTPPPQVAPWALPQPPSPLLSFSKRPKGSLYTRPLATDWNPAVTGQADTIQRKACPSTQTNKIRSLSESTGRQDAVSDLHWSPGFGTLWHSTPPGQSTQNNQEAQQHEMIQECVPPSPKRTTSKQREQ